MSDAGIEAMDQEPEAPAPDETLVQARMDALLARFPGRFSDEELVAIRTKIAGHAAMAKALHNARLGPSIEPPPFVPYVKEES